MASSLQNFPASAVVDVFLSYIQWVFGNTDIVPTEYRWSSDDRASKIRISAPFVIDNEKPNSQPFVIVERGVLVFANRTIDNVKSGNANVLTDIEKVDWLNGTINVISGSEAAGEASSIANLLAMIIHADRKGIMEQSKFIRDLKYSSIGPEIPVVKDSQVRRWEVTTTFNVSLQVGWTKTIQDPVSWESAAIYFAKNPAEMTSEKGETTLGAATLTDATKDFGYLTSSDPQLLEQELDLGWYYIRFRDNEYKQLYTVVEIVDSNTLRLQTHDESNDPIAWSAPATAANLEYDLLWNDFHIHMELPTGV